jgi:hypothetical protein
MTITADAGKGIDGECSSKERDEEGRKHSTKRLLLLSEL